MALITTRFTAASTADEVVTGLDLDGLRAVVTGGASGIGLETARTLARAGADVLIGVRDLSAGHRAADEIALTTGREVRVGLLDLADQDSVGAFGSAWEGPLHLLIANAGVMACPLTRTREGWELQFATNHLGHFALALGLHAALAAGAAQGRGARVVSVSSSGHLGSPVVFDDVHFDRRAYDPWAAYGQSKTANVLFAVEATRRWASEGIVANALMPGGIMTNLQRHVPQSTRDAWAAMERAGTFVVKTAQQGAATTLVAAVAPEFADVGGRYLEDGNEVETVADDADVGRGVRRWAVDPDSAARLWDASLTMLERGRG